MAQNRLILCWLVVVALCGLRVDAITVCYRNFLQLQCPEDQVLDLSNAFFGRNDTETCSDVPDYYRCADTKNLIYDRCLGQNSCSELIEVETLGNPCRGVNKYLELDYSCIEASSVVTMCEDDEVTTRSGSGIIYSPDFPESFTGETSCKLMFDNPEGTRVQLQLFINELPSGSCDSSLTLESDATDVTTCDDLESFENGLDSTKGQLKFISHSSDQGQRFVLKYTVSGCPLDDLPDNIEERIDEFVEQDYVTIKCPDGFMLAEPLNNTAFCKGNEWMGVEFLSDCVEKDPNNTDTSQTTLPPVPLSSKDFSITSLNETSTRQEGTSALTNTTVAPTDQSTTVYITSTESDNLAKPSTNTITADLSGVEGQRSTTTTQSPKTTSSEQSSSTPPPRTTKTQTGEMTQAFESTITAPPTLPPRQRFQNADVKQQAFSVLRSRSMPLCEAGEVITFDSVITNIGNVFQNETSHFKGEFRAFYVFMWSIFSEFHQVGLMKNGQQVALSIRNGNNSATNQIVLNLEEKDEVWLEALDDCTDGGNIDTTVSFLGYMLWTNPLT